MASEVPEMVQSLPKSFLLGHPVVASCLAVLVSLIFIARRFSPKVEVGEPPLIPSRVPFFGHLFGILFEGMRYFVDVGEKCDYPIYTLPVLGSKVYVITSPDLVTATMRETKTMSFNPFIVEVFRRMLGLSYDFMAKVRENMDSRSVPGYMGDMHRVQAAALAPGAALDRMNETVLRRMAAELEGLEMGKSIDLYTTVRRIVAVSSVRASFGAENPLEKVPGLMDDFWVFEGNLKWLLLNAWPSLTVRRAHLARKRLRDAFLEYYEQGRDVHAAAFVRARSKVARKYGLSLEGIAAFDVGILFGILANAVPTPFWMLVYIYDSPDLLAAVRKEMKQLVSISDDTITIDLQSDAHLRKTCPILTSAFHETLRHISSSLSSGRYVLSDTWIERPSTLKNPTPQPILLKAGATVQIPSASVHYSKSMASQYAPTPKDFVPSRFADLSMSEPERSMNGSFRAFGGGTTLCPGRKFAYMELVGFVTMFTSLFDMEGLKGVPAKDESKIAIAVAKPAEDVVVRLQRRPGLGGKRIRVEIGKHS